MTNYRYSSGTSLERTPKEEAIDRLERDMMTDFSDDLYKELKRLSLSTLKLLRGEVNSLVMIIREESSR